MKKITLGGMQASDIVLGCMRISDMAVSRVQELLETAVEEGINYFDHADLYGHGASEEVFAKAMGQKPSLRERIYLQSKCGIRDEGGLFRYDFSKSHILKSVDGILKRLNTDYLDALLLHRPDPVSYTHLIQYGKRPPFSGAEEAFLEYDPYDHRLVDERVLSKIKQKRLLFMPF